MTIGHNTTPELIKQTVEEVERANDEIKALQEHRAEVFKKAKSLGLDPRIIRKAIALRAMDADKLAEQEALLELYMAALGDYASTELGKAGAPR